VAYGLSGMWLLKCRVGQNRTCIYTVYDHMFGDFPFKGSVNTLYIYGFGQPYMIGTWLRLFEWHVVMGVE